MSTSNTLLINELYNLSQRFLTASPNAYQRKILEDLKKSRLSIIIGQRGVGKTTFLLQQLLAITQHNPLDPSILYLPCDHFLIGNHSLYEIGELFCQMGGKLIAFDEIHQYPQWSKELKSLFDSFPTLTILASGSSALEIRKGTHDLSRRAVVKTMPGYSFREYLEFQHQMALPSIAMQDLLADHRAFNHHIIQSVEAKLSKILVEFKKYLQVGYYPYYVQFNDTNLYYITLEQNVLYTLESDLPSLYPALTGHSIRKIKQLMSYITQTAPFTTNLNNLRKMLDIGDDRTLKIYLHYLQECALIRLLMKSSSKFQKLESPEKIYLNNPNQMSALAGGNPNLGTLRELFFLSMVSYKHQLSIPSQGDFIIDDRWLVEIGGRNKDFSQIKTLPQAFLACDDIEFGAQNKIPLWLFGFLY